MKGSLPDLAELLVKGVYSGLNSIECMLLSRLIRFVTLQRPNKPESDRQWLIQRRNELSEVVFVKLKLTLIV